MESIMVDATKSNFLEKSNDFIKHLPNASFIAIDEEMTGIVLPPGTAKPPSKDETPADRYPSLKLVPERYAIIQLGICLFEQRGGLSETESVDHASFHVRRYKFTLFPPADSSISREVVLNPSSMHFLAQNNMNLDQWTREGIPFCTGDIASGLLNNFFEDEKKKAEGKPSFKSTSFNSRERIELTRVEDKDFHARAMAGLREWLDSAISPDDTTSEGTSFLLPPCSAFLRRALYESIPIEYPNLVLETYEGSQIRVWRMNAIERRRREKRLLREGWENLLKEKVGAWRVFLALSKACRGEHPTTQAEHMALSLSVESAMRSIDEIDFERLPKTEKTPLVVHNGLHDLLFLLTHFHTARLPDTWEECKGLIHSYFPIIYDTKVMSSEYCSRGNSRNHTHLAAVYQQAISRYPQWGGNVFSSDHGEVGDQEHDAAFDAYMTGVAFCGLSYIIHEQTRFTVDVSRSKFALWEWRDKGEIPSELYGRNKINFHLSPYTIDLESPDSDPMRRGMSKASTFRISNADPNISTRDIVRSFRGLVDANGENINFEIIWIDNTSFLVGVMIEGCSDQNKFQQQKDILYKALRGRFQRETIKSLEVEKETKPLPGFWNLWGWLGKQTVEDDRPTKKMRLN